MKIVKQSASSGRTRNPGNSGRQTENHKFQQLVERANRGNTEARAELMAILDRHPQIWREVAELAENVRLALIDSISGSNVLVSESLKRKSAELESELLDNDPSCLQRLVVKRFVAAWLQLQRAECAVARDYNDLATAKFYAKRQEVAARQFERSLKSLQEHRKKKSAPGSRFTQKQTGGRRAADQTPELPIFPPDDEQQAG